MTLTLKMSAARISVALLMTVALLGCATQSIEFTDFRNPTELKFVGSATSRGDRIRVSPGERSIQGAVWHAERWNINRGFEVSFDFQIHEFGDWPPGYYHDVSSDGFAFVFQDASSMALGSGGGGMSYHELPSTVAVEFDMWPNSDEGDPNGNHISVQSGGDEPTLHIQEHSLGCVSELPDMSDEAVHTGMITYDPGTLSVYLDDMSEPVLEVNIDLAETIGSEDGRAWVGFSAASGYFQQAHDILRWEMTTRP